MKRPESAPLARRARRGFTFVEMLAAMLFMAIVIPVAMEGILLAGRVGIAAQRRREATQLADGVLTEMLATEAWRDGDQTGDFGPDRPNQRWTLTTESWTEDTMRLITVSVTYTVQDREYQVRLSTLGDETEPETSSTSESAL